MRPEKAGPEQVLLGVRTIEIAGVTTRVLELPGTGPAVLLLHGFSDSADTWRPVLAHLARLGRRAVAVDLPGFGRAGRLPREQGLLAPLDRFVDALVHTYNEGERCVVAGNSLGAVLALRAAERELPLAGCAAISPAGLEMSPSAWAVDWILEGPLLRLVSRAPVPKAIVQRAASFVYGRYAGRGVDPAVAKLYGGHFVRGLGDLRRFGAMARALADDLRAGAYRFDRVKVPILLLWGARDPFCLVSGARAVIDAVPGTRLVVLDGCGHCAQLEAPETIAGELAALSQSAKPWS